MNCVDVAHGHYILLYDDYFNNICDLLDIKHTSSILQSIKALKDAAVMGVTFKKSLVDNDAKIAS